MYIHFMLRVFPLFFKQLSVIVLFSALLAACQDVYGPDWTLTFENATNSAQSFTLSVNGESALREISIPPGSSVTLSFTGTFTKSDLPLPFLWESVLNGWRIIEAAQDTISVQNGLPIPVVLKDSKISEWRLTVDAAATVEQVKVFRTAHNFYLDGGWEENGARFIESDGVIYQYSIGYNPREKIRIALAGQE